MYRLLILLLVWLLCWAPASPARAQSAAAVSSAREIASRAMDHYRAEEYELAAEKFLRAYEVVKVSTLALYTARSLVELGRWVEASEIYLQGSLLKDSGTNAEAQARARRQAALEREELLRRIPKLMLDIRNAPGREVTIFIEDEEIPAAIFDTGVPVDPGLRRVTAEFGEQRLERSIELSEGESSRLTLEFETSQDEQTAPSVEHFSDNGAGRKVNWPGWLTLGVGVSATAVGGVLGIVAIDKKDQLDQSGLCEQRSCFSQASGSVQSYQSTKTASGVALIGGGIAIAAGATLLVLNLPPQRGEGVAIRPVVGLGQVGVAGSF